MHASLNDLPKGPARAARVKSKFVIACKTMLDRCRPTC
ncbi:hypothetical protein thalar_01760 [Litoreibacter arenae DSM 19593]|uniref:Uncharacterized protein n=1 Tax=Litoreibacter arenae DSM 19593 TaxID=1123360 RepID=S9RY81_9RHOB|nr:hypothetical protein thalar_01760 [Litoreibacter arenae DSM 19593]